MAGEKSVTKKQYLNILRKVELELSTNDYTTNSIDLDKLILNKAFETFHSNVFFDDSELDTSSLKYAPLWKFMERRFSQSRGRMDEALKFASLSGITVPEKISKSGLEDTEKFIFSVKKKEIIPLIDNTISTGSRSYNTPLYEIPNLKNLKDALHEIDRYRDKVVRELDGTKDSRYIARVMKNINSIASRYITHYEKTFTRETARIARLKRTNNIIVYNEEIFKAASSNFMEIKQKVSDYGESSGDFIEQIFLPGKIKTGQFIKLYKYRNNRYNEYLSLFESLTADSKNLALTGSIDANTIYRAAMRGSVEITKSLMKPAGIPSDVRRTMTEEKLKECRKTGADFKKSASLLAGAIRKNYNDYAAEHSGIMKKRKESKKESEIKIVQAELDILFDYAISCSQLRNSMNYTKEALRRYENTYGLIKNNISKQIYSAKVTAQLKQGSLLPLIKNFDTARIDAETSSRKILEKEGMNSLSGAVGLYRYYIRNGIRAKIIPEDGQIRETRKNLTSRTSVKVASWTMNENNFREVDLKAAANLGKLLNISAWNISPADERIPSVLTADGKALRISMTIPGGWTISPKEEKLSGYSINKSYLSPDRNGEIKITAVKDSDSGLRAFSEEWFRRTGFTMIKKNWGTLRNTEFLWTLASGSMERVMESYMIRKNGYVIILSGRCIKNKYDFMRRQMAEVFTSMQI